MPAMSSMGGRAMEPAERGSGLPRVGKSRTLRPVRPAIYDEGLRTRMTAAVIAEEGAAIRIEGPVALHAIGDRIVGRRCGIVGGRRRRIAWTIIGRCSERAADQRAGCEAADECAAAEAAMSVPADLLDICGLRWRDRQRIADRCSGRWRQRACCEACKQQDPGNRTKRFQHQGLIVMQRRSTPRARDKATCRCRWIKVSTG